MSGQMLNYLRITKLRVGLILDFNKARLNLSELSCDFLSVLICVHPWLKI